MWIRKCILIVALFVLSFVSSLFSQIVVQGQVTDNGGEYLGGGAAPVINALVTITDQADNNRSFQAHTDTLGSYYFSINETGVEESDTQNPSGFELFQNYPNPFNPNTVIAYQLIKPADIQIEIYNVLGQKIKTLFKGFQSNCIGQSVWDATDDLGQGVSAGVYIYSLISEGVRITKKMVLTDGYMGHSVISPSRAIFPVATIQHELRKQLSNQYFLQVSGTNIETYQEPITISSSFIHDIKVNRTVTDMDGNVYKTVKIGNQWWMAENLKVTRYCNGDQIELVINNDDWKTRTTGAYCNYRNNEANVATYGRLYNWHAVKDSRGLAPAGWHVPSDAEWKQLELFLGMSQSDADRYGQSPTPRGSDQGGQLKEAGLAHWINLNRGATNTSGFSALPGGYRWTSGDYLDIGYRAFFWSSTEYSTLYAWYRILYYHYADVGRYNDGGEHCGFSVRCVRDN